MQHEEAMTVFAALARDIQRYEAQARVLLEKVLNLEEHLAEREAEIARLLLMGVEAPTEQPE